MKPVGAGHWTAIHYSISGGRCAAIMVVENDFDPTPKDPERDTALLELISPHAIRASRLARALKLARSAAQTHAGFIDAIALPLVVLSADGSFQFANTGGQRLIETGHLLSLNAKWRLALPHRSDTDLLYGLMTEITDTLVPRAMQFATDDANMALCITDFHTVGAMLPVD
ncbi:MAG: hypothetical protein KDJ77_17130 [Rhodobiaceae bacterium]|nr:hypothetical protein [Rhodobiaceae bacterium]